MKVFSEYTDIEFPEFLIKRGFIDESWHNDMTAKAVRKLDKGSIVVWVGHDDPTQREIRELKKFTVCLYSSDLEDNVEIFITDNPHSCAEVVDTLFRIFEVSDG